MKVKDLNLEDRPRERLLKNGPRALSDVELLAILIGSGTKDNTVFDIASSILKLYHLDQLKDLNYEKISKIRGIKKAKACKLLACFEIARRSIQKKIPRICLEDPQSIYDYIYDEVYLENHEIVIAILCDCKLHPIKTVIERSDYTHQILFPTKRIISEALESNSYAVILIHNHPSGDVKPSQADIGTTLEFRQLLLSLDILLLDHLVVSSSKYYSMHEHGLLSNNDEYDILGDCLEKITL